MSSENLTSLEVFDIIWGWLKASPLCRIVPTMYPYKYPDVTPDNPLSGEFLVVKPLTNVTGDSQVATVNVNIYVPDDTPSIHRVEQRYPKIKRLSELTKVAYGSLQGFPVSERWFFDVSDENVFSEDDIPYSFSNIRVTLKRF